jgi:hypothetical protein
MARALLGHTIVRGVNTYAVIWTVLGFHLRAYITSKLLPCLDIQAAG